MRSIRYLSLILLCHLSPIFLFSDQVSDIVSVQSGDLISYVNALTGRFNLMDLSQKNPDNMSVLFGGTSTASSYVAIFVDDEVYTFDQLDSVYPFGEGLGAVEGIFLAGKKKDVKIDTSFFSMDIKGDSSFGTIGLAFAISNQSRFESHRVAVKIMLDTDVGENKNDPLIYLPSGSKVTQSLLIKKDGIPPYFFLGKNHAAMQPAQGDGYYLYPLLSKNIPSLVLIGNWLRLSDTKPVQSLNNPDFNFDHKTSKDAGFALYFGDYYLTAGETQYFGIALSKYFVTMCPLLDEEILKNGVFSPLRFETQEILDNPNMRNKSDIVDMLDTSGDPYFEEKSQRKTARQRYRWEKLGWMRSQETGVVSQPLHLDMIKDDIWNSVSDLDSQLNQLDKTLDSTLDFSK